ncbi:PQQ-binding-like beta-propeller repeat protein [Dactylosporangium sp. CA-233914]|uniref:outer membrane protein assembly factor BamB family protein n=1 Tax=Dactylosporangium sp. CA-233914 TaxID=3239934 RepID=UPI003D8B385C
MRRPYTAAGLLVVPAAVLTASVAAHPQPVAAPSLETATADAGGRPGDLVRGASFEMAMRDLVGYDPTAGTIVAQADAGAELAGIDAHTGAVRWRRQLDDSGEYGTVLWSQNDLGAGSVLVNSLAKNSRAAELTALSTRTGEVRWRMPLTARTEAMAAGPALLVGEPAPDSSSMRWANPRDAPRDDPGATPTRNAENGGKPTKSPSTATWGPRAARTPGTKTSATSGAARKTRVNASPTAGPGLGPSPSPSPSPSKAAGNGKDQGRSRIGHADEDAGSVVTRNAPEPGTFSAVAAGDGGRLWTAELAEGCELRAAAGDGKTTAVRLACGEHDRLEIRDARTGALRSRTELDPVADDGGLGLLVRDGATLVRGARTFQVFGPDGARLVARDGDGCAEFCDLAVEGDVAIVAQSGGSTDRADGALEAFALADGAERWRAERTVRALVREGGRLYAIGPAPQPVPFLAVSGVGERGVSAPVATALPAGAIPQRGSAVLVADDRSRSGKADGRTRSGSGKGDVGLAWYRIRAVDTPAGYLGGAVQRPDPCRVVPPGDLAKRLGKQRVTAHRDDAATCTFTNGKDAVRVRVLWAGTDEDSAKQRFDVVKGDSVQRYGSVVVGIEKA